MRRGLAVVGVVAASMLPAGAAVAEPIVVHESGDVGSDACGVWYDTGWYAYDPSTGYIGLRAPAGGGDFADCI